MNNNQLFDELIKDQLQDYSPAVHPRIWENIADVRKKRRPAGFWITMLQRRNLLLVAGLLLATAGGAYLLIAQRNNSIQQAAAQPVAAAKNNTTTVSADQHSASANENNNNTTTNQQNITTGTGSNSNISTTDSEANQLMAAENNNSVFSGKKKMSNSGRSLIKTKTPGVTEDATDNAVTDNFNKKKTSTSDETESADVLVIDQNSNTIYPARLFFTGPKSITSSQQSAALQKRMLANINLPGCPSIEKNAAGNKTYIEVYGGPDVAFRSMSDTGNSVYLQKRKESTKFSSAYSAGIRYTKVFDNGMSIRTGINYSQINEKFTYLQGNLVQLTYIINANGDTTGSYITTGTRYKTTINRFRTIDVPIVVGYELGNGRIHANINAGVIINAYSWQKGDVLDTAFKPVSITTGKGNSPYQFKTNIGTGLMISSSVYYKLNDKLHILLEPYFRYNLSPMSNEKITLTQKYNTAGIRLGLRLDLH